MALSKSFSVMDNPGVIILLKNSNLLQICESMPEDVMTIIITYLTWNLAAALDASYKVEDIYHMRVNSFSFLDLLSFHFTLSKFYFTGKNGKMWRSAIEDAQKEFQLKSNEVTWLHVGCDLIWRSTNSERLTNFFLFLWEQLEIVYQADWLQKLSDFIVIVCATAPPTHPVDPLRVRLLFNTLIWCGLFSSILSCCKTFEAGTQFSLYFGKLTKANETFPLISLMLLPFDQCYQVREWRKKFRVIPEIHTFRTTKPISSEHKMCHLLLVQETPQEWYPLSGYISLLFKHYLSSLSSEEFAQRRLHLIGVFQRSCSLV